MKITPVYNHIYIKADEPTVGGLNMSAKRTTVEYGTVVAVADGITTVKVGDKIFYKAWAVDLININKEEYYFIDVSSNGILAIYENNSL